MTKLQPYLTLVLSTLLVVAAGCGGKKPVYESVSRVHSNPAYDPRTNDAATLSGPNFAIRIRGPRSQRAFLVYAARRFLEAKGFRYVVHTRDANLLLDFMTTRQLRLQIFAFFRGTPPISIFEGSSCSPQPKLAVRMLLEPSLLSRFSVSPRPQTRQRQSCWYAASSAPAKLNLKMEYRPRDIVVVKVLRNAIGEKLQAPMNMICLNL